LLVAMRRRMPCSLALLLALLAAGPARAVIIDSGDGTGNKTAPPDDPGWAYLATMGGVSAVYLGDGWVLAAAHAPIGPLALQSMVYTPVAGSEIQLSNDDETLADLVVFAIHGLPSLPPQPIRATAPPIGTAVVMGGKGADRGGFTVWNPPGPGGPYSGWLWAGTANRRWGTNLVDGYPPMSEAGNTVAFSTAFDAGLPTPHEAQAAVGDSGGAVWIDNGSEWELAGLLISIEIYEGQPAAALYGNKTYAADLSYYRDEILDIVALPEPGSAAGLVAGAGFLLLLGRRRIRP
jgi:hypothetical protein